MTFWTISQPAKAAADAVYADATRIRSALGSRAATSKTVDAAKLFSRQCRENLDALDRELFGVRADA